MTIIGPSGSTTDTTPTITWNAAANADHYSVLVYSTTRGQLVASNANVTGTELTVPTSLAVDTYRVYVRAVSTDGTNGTWGAINFSIASSAPGNVSIIGPNGSTTDTTPTINWNAAANADRYQVLIYSTTLGQLVASGDNITGTSLTVGSPLASDSYRVYIRAINSSGDAGSWSAHNFSIAAAASLSDFEFQDMYWELASSRTSERNDLLPWSV